MEYIHFKTGIPGIIPPDCSELIPPPPEACDEPIVHGPEQTRDGVVNTSYKRRMMPCNKE